MELKALLILYILGLFIIGKAAGKSKTIEELNLANGEIGWVSSAFAIAATWIWAPALFVASERAYVNGLLGVFWFIVPNILSLIVFGILSKNAFNHYNGEHTLSELMGNIYKSRRIKNIYNFELIFLAACSTGVQLLAGGKVIEQLTGFNFGLIVLLLAVVTLLYTYNGGMKANVYTDVFQMVLMLITVTVGLVFLKGKAELNLGGFNNLDISFFSKQNWKYFIAFGLTTTIGLLSGPIGDQSYWQIAFAMDKKKVTRTFVVASIIFAIVPICMAVIGFMAAGQGYIAIDNSMVGLEFIRNNTNELIVALFIVCVISGLSSTLDSNMCAVGSIFSTYKEEKGTIKDAQRGIIITTIFGTLIANIPNLDIFWLFLFYGVLRSSVAIPTVFTFLSKRPLKESSIYNGIIGAFIIGIPIYTVGAIFGIQPLSFIGTLLTVLIPLTSIIGGNYVRKKEGELQIKTTTLRGKE